MLSSLRRDFPRYFLTMALLLVVLQASQRQAHAQLEALFEFALETASVVLEDFAQILYQEALQFGAKATVNAAANALSGGNSTPTPSTSEDIKRLKREIEQFAERDLEHAAAYRALSYKIDERMTREQVRAMLMEVLNKVDGRLAKLANRIDQQQRELDRFSRDLGLTRGELITVGSRVAQHETQLNDFEQRMNDLEIRYPRHTRPQQAAALSSNGFAALWRGHHSDALKAFQYAHAFDPAGPEHLYGQAFAYYMAGDVRTAQEVAAKGVIAERGRPLPQWYIYAMQSTSGPHREFVEDQRRNAIFGVKAPGMLSLPTIEARR